MMDSSKASVPPIKNLTVDNITENVIRINSQGPDPRLNYVFERLVSHLHDFARETRIDTKEWMAAIHFLTATGQKCVGDRQVGCFHSSAYMVLIYDCYLGMDATL